MFYPYRAMQMPLRNDTRVLHFDEPQIMGIVNVTPDSFYAGSRTFAADAIASRVEQMVEEGVDMLDVGAYSTRPGADEVTADEEYARLERGLGIVKKIAPDVPISVDTFRADVARKCVEQLGVDIVNDVSGGTLDERMFATVAELQVPYVLMHMRGTPATMQQLTHYPQGVTQEVMDDLTVKINCLKDMGFTKVIVDPGFGFSKTVDQNYELMAQVGRFHELGLPLFVGVSRKSMIYKPLGITPADSLNGTTVLNTMALLLGAHILRVHDVKPAVEAREIVKLYRNNYK